MQASRTSLALQLCRAVNDGEPRAVEALLLRGASPNLVLHKGVAAVHLAAGKETEKRIRCLKLLLQYGADPNVRSVEDLTPVHIAALWGCYQNLKLLLQNGGNPNLEDQDGNKATDLAKQQENRRCAQLLQKYQSWDALEAEDEDLSQFQYSFYRGQDGTDNNAVLRDLSLVSDVDDGPLSSTRRSSLLQLSQFCSRPSWNGRPCVSALSDRELDWDPAALSVLSSTRMSQGGPGVLCKTLPVVDEEAPFVDNLINQHKHPGSFEGPSNALFLTLDSSSCHTSRKSVSFKEMDDYFPVFDAESPQQLEDQSHQSSVGYAVDLSEYPEFFNSERVATVLQNQGIDVTSPDHVFVFSRDNHCNSPDLDKTVAGHWLEEEEEKEGDGDSLAELKEPVQPPSSSSDGGSSSSSSGGSEYTSCDSDHYTTAVGLNLHHKDVSPESDLDETREIASQDDSSAGTASSILQQKAALQPQPPLITDIVLNPVDGHGPEGSDATFSDEFRQGVRSQFLPIKTILSPMGLAAVDQGLSPLMNDLTLAHKSLSSKFKAEDQKDLNVPVEGAELLASDEVMINRGLIVASKATCEYDGQEGGLLLTPSPFVTGRTRSRLSRCSVKNNSDSGSNLLPSTSYLFEETLPTPVRLQRSRTRAQDGSRTPGNAPFSLRGTPIHSSSEEPTLSEPNFVKSTLESCKTTRPNTLEADSQADTLIISGSAADTVILERDSAESLTDSSKSLLACPTDVAEFLTDDLSTSNGMKSSVELNSADSLEKVCRFGSIAEEPWIIDEMHSGDSVSEDRGIPIAKDNCSSPEARSKLPATPTTGCTPRYSISRLSACHKPQSLANLSYTPGGRPLIVDQEEPVEYLYTDFEEGHKLIECHVPPTANVTLNSDTSEDTILYDWRSLQLSPRKGKENVYPQKEDLPDVSGLTDRELRNRLKNLGEDPGPINIFTRPIHIQKLRELQQETINQQPAVHNPGYSVELASALHAFCLPDCQADELALCQQFDQPDQNRKWREGIIKSSFNYLLLDPRVTKNLPCRSLSVSPVECFQIFVKAIFYIGKGKRSRPYSHLYEALEYHKGDKTSKKLCSKVQHIMQVWKAGLGVVSLHCFQNVIPVEAYTREACMVDAIGLKMLTNQKRGDYYGVVSTWSMKRRREMGVHLLYRAMQIFLAEGERQLRPADIRVGH
ncbi:ankyrin repeat and LEM domain-containing protein 1 [Arapaima gigas]